MMHIHEFEWPDSMHNDPNLASVFLLLQGLHERVIVSQEFSHAPARRVGGRDVMRSRGPQLTRGEGQHLLQLGSYI